MKYTTENVLTTQGQQSEKNGNTYNTLKVTKMKRSRENIVKAKGARKCVTLSLCLGIFSLFLLKFATFLSWFRT